MEKHSENIDKWLQIIHADGVGAIAEIEDLRLKIENLMKFCGIIEVY